MRSFVERFRLTVAVAAGVVALGFAPAGAWAQQNPYDANGDIILHEQGAQPAAPKQQQPPPPSYKDQHKDQIINQQIDQQRNQQQNQASVTQTQPSTSQKPPGATTAKTSSPAQFVPPPKPLVTQQTKKRQKSVPQSTSSPTGGS